MVILSEYIEIYSIDQTQKYNLNNFNHDIDIIPIKINTYNKNEDILVFPIKSIYHNSIKNDLDNQKNDSYNQKNDLDNQKNDLDKYLKEINQLRTENHKLKDTCLTNKELEANLKKIINIII